jgi:hypothetical protein
MEGKVMERRNSKPAEALSKATTSEVPAAPAPAPVSATSPLPQRLAELERQIGAALSSSNETASALQNLFFQLERALPAAAEYARLENERALDPTQAPDPHQARQSAEDANFLSNRLASLKSRLSVACARQIEKETAAAYLEKFNQFLPEHDALEQEFAEQYQLLVGKLVELFERLRDFQQRARTALGDPPASVPVLAPINGAALLDKIKLVALADGKELWPPPSIPLGVTLAQGMKFAFDPRFSSEWGNAKLQEARITAAQREAERTAARFRQMTVEQEQRQNEEEKQRFAAAHGMK